MTHHIKYIGILLLASSLFACKNGFKGEANLNLPPDTHTVIDTIIRTGENRFNSQVSINWWGDDSDGYIQGYEFTFAETIDDNTIWEFTTALDSDFVLAPPPGFDTINFGFHVRAIDNLGERDPSPAFISYPIKNSAPSVKFLPGTNNPVRTFPAIKLFWQGSDPDGETNLKHYELYWNDTTATPYIVDVSASSATFIANNPDQNQSDCSVYINNTSTPLDNAMPGLNLNATNFLYIRAIDKSDAESDYVASYSFYVKKVSSTILLVNAYPDPSSTTALEAETFYGQQLSTQGFSTFDTLQLYQNVNDTTLQLSPDNPTQSRVFDLFETLIWFGEVTKPDPVTEEVKFNSLEIARKTTDNFFNQGGKLLMSISVHSKVTETPEYVDFSPINSFVTPGGDTTLKITDTTVIPLDLAWPVLKADLLPGQLVSMRPFQPISGATNLYNANLLAQSGANIEDWTGVSTVMSLKKNNSNKTNFIVSTLELHTMNGDNNIDQLFDKILHGEFEL